MKFQRLKSTTNYFFFQLAKNDVMFVYLFEISYQFVYYIIRWMTLYDKYCYIETDPIPYRHFQPIKTATVIFDIPPQK